MENNNLLSCIINWNEQFIRPYVQRIIYLRVPVTVALISFLIFTTVEQTIEVYRYVALDRNTFQAFVSTFLVFVLSFLVWYSARLLELEYKLELKNKLELELEKILDGQLELKNKLELELKKILDGQNELDLSFLPEFLGFLPIAGVTIGIFRANSSLDETFLATWFWGCVIGCLIYLIYFIGHFLIITIRLVLLLLSLPLSLRFTLVPPFVVFNNDRQDQSSSSTQINPIGVRKQGLFGNSFEHFFVYISYTIFNVLSLPIIHATSTSYWGIIAILFLEILLTLMFLSWHQEQKTQIRILFIFSLIISGLALFKLPPVLIPNRLDSVSIVAIGLSIITVVLATIYDWGIQNRIPALTGLIVLLVISSLLNWNDNHKFRTLESIEKLPTLEESFSNWFDNRKDLSKYKDAGYPVYIISAQGGGIFAAYHSATALSKLQDKFPDFSQHIFAISGVSGGSFGAATFSSLVKQNSECLNKERNLGNLESKARQVLEQDLLSPLLVMGLFPDLLQRFIPFSFPQWDRAVGLEIAFEEAWKHTQGGENPFEKSYYDHWSPKKIAPALVMNTTVVETGERLLISPFSLPNGKNIVLNGRDVSDENKIDFRLSTAAGLSARFPFVTPVGWYHKSNNNKGKSRLADGGYFDNSGVLTAIDIGRALEQIKIEKPELKFNVIYLAIVDKPNHTSDNKPNYQGLNEIGSPLRTFWNVKGSRDRTIIQQAEEILNNGIENPLKFKFRTLLLNKKPNKVSLPLGWLLSKYSQKEIDKQNDDSDSGNCRLDKPELNHNACVAKSIEYDGIVQQKAVVLE